MDTQAWEVLIEHSGPVALQALQLVLKEGLHSIEGHVSRLNMQVTDNRDEVQSLRRAAEIFHAAMKDVRAATEEREAARLRKKSETRAALYSVMSRFE